MINTVMKKLAFAMLSTLLLTTHSISANPLNGKVKYIELQPERKITTATSTLFKLKNSVVFFKQSPELGVELYRQLPGEQKLVKFFGGKDFADRYSKVFHWDDDKLLFYIPQLEQWYVTDGTSEGTAVTEFINEQQFEYIQTTSNGKYLVLNDDEVLQYDPATEQWTSQAIDLIDFPFVEPITSIGNYLFLSADQSLYRMDVNTLAVEELVNYGQNFYIYNFHDAKFYNSSISNTLQSDVHALEAISKNPLDLEGFFVTEQESLYQLNWIHAQTGEIEQLPFNSELPFRVGSIIHNQTSMYFELIINGPYSQLIKVNLSDYSFEELTPNNSDTPTNYIGYTPLIATESGVLVKAEVSSTLEKRSHLYFINENGDTSIVQYQDNPVDYIFDLTSYHETHAYFEARDPSANDDQIWRLDLQTLQLNRMTTPASTSSWALSYALGNDFYLQNSQYSSTDASIDFVSRVNIDNATLDRLHTFDKGTSTTNISGELLPNKSGAIMNLLNTPSERSLKHIQSNGQIIEILSQNALEDVRDVFSSADSDWVFVVQHRQIEGYDDEQFILSAINPATSDINEITVLPMLQDGSFFEELVEFDNDKLLVRIRNNSSGTTRYSNYGVVDIVDKSFYLHQTDVDEHQFFTAKLCQDNQLFFGSNHYYFKKGKGEYQKTELSHIRSAKHSNDGYTVLVTRGGEPTTEKILSVSCTSGALTTHIEYAVEPYDSIYPQINTGHDGWFYINYGQADNQGFNTLSGEQSDFALDIDSADGKERIRLDWHDTSYGMFGFEVYSALHNGKNTVLTDIYKLEGNTQRKLDTFVGYYSSTNHARYDPYERIFNLFVEGNQGDEKDLIYFSPADEKLHYIDLIPGKARVYSFNSFSFSPEGILYINTYRGYKGSDIAAINLNCAQLDNGFPCSQPLENSTPTIFGQNVYEYNPGQHLYIPIRAHDNDNDALSIHIDGVPQWLTLENGILQGTVPSNENANWSNLVANVADIKGASAHRTFSLNYVATTQIPAEFVSLNTQAPEPEPEPEPTTPPSNSSNSSGGGGSTGGMLALLIFIGFNRRRVK